MPSIQLLSFCPLACDESFNVFSFVLWLNHYKIVWKNRLYKECLHYDTYIITILSVDLSNINFALDRPHKKSCLSLRFLTCYWLTNYENQYIVFPNQCAYCLGILVFFFLVLATTIVFQNIKLSKNSINWTVNEESFQKRKHFL